MKVALCLSGQVRAIDANGDTIRRYLVESAQADVFCHFWDSGMGGKERAEYAIQKFNPVSSHIQEQIDFTEYPGKGNTPRTRSQFYSVKKSNNLRKEYEAKHGFLYDFVIRSRTDLIIKKPFDPTAHDPNCIYARSNAECGDKIVQGEFVYTYREPKTYTSDFKFRDDQFLIANSQNMDLYCMIYDELDELVHLLKDSSFVYNHADGRKETIKGACIAGETAMIYNHNKHLSHITARVTDIPSTVGSGQVNKDQW